MPDCYYNDKIVSGLAGVSRGTLKKWAKKGHGPERRKIGPRKVGYLASEVDRWLAERGQATAPAGAEVST